MRKNKSIAESVRLWMVVVAVAPLLIMTLQGYHCAREAVLQLKTEHLNTVVEAKQMRIDDWIAERKRQMQSLASFAAIQAGEGLGGQATQILFNQERVNNPAYESFALYSKDWKRMADSGHSMHDDEMLLSPAFQATLSSGSEAAVSKPHIHEDGMIGIHIGIPVSGGTRFLVAVLDLSDTLYPILETPIDRTTTIRSYIVAEDGVLLSPPSDGVQPLENRIKLPEEQLGGGDRPAVYRDVHGEQVVGVSVPLKGLGWVLVSEARTRDAFAWLGVLRTRALVTGLITLILVFLLAWKSAKRISLPLRRMAEVAHAVSEGHYDSRMEHFHGLEHAEVADAFNRMLDEIARAQARLAQAAALSAIGQLSASIVHEMRNPLSAIKMNLEVLNHAVQDNPLHRELGQIAAEQVLRLETMLGDLLQYGKMVELEKTAVPASAFMEEVESCIRWEEGKAVSFVFRNDSGAETLSIDREHMLRAVSNLVDNAIQASPDGGTVTLVLHSSPANPEELFIEVSDQGSGIPKRVAEKLFDPFFTTKKKGTGLGLANVKKIVELHGGRISFRNLDPGTVFTITLPNNGDTE